MYSMMLFSILFLLLIVSYNQPPLPCRAGKVSLVGEDVAESGLALLHIDDGLVGIAHWSELNPGLDALVGRKLEHLVDLSRAADERACETATLEDQAGGVERDSLLGETNLHHGAVELQQAKVVMQRHLREIAC